MLRRPWWLSILQNGSPSLPPQKGAEDNGHLTLERVRDIVAGTSCGPVEFAAASSDDGLVEIAISAPWLERPVEFGAPCEGPRFRPWWPDRCRSQRNRLGGTDLCAGPLGSPRRAGRPLRGLVLPVDHPFWQTHGPPNELGWRPFGLTQAPAQDPTPHPRRKVKRGFPTPTNSHLFQPRLTNSREFSGRPMRGNSRTEGTRPVRSGLPPPPSSPANLYRDETRAGFPYSFRGFCRSRVQHETRGKCGTGRTIGPGSRFPGGAFAPTQRVAIQRVDTEWWRRTRATTFSNGAPGAAFSVDVGGGLYTSKSMAGGNQIREGDVV